MNDISGFGLRINLIASNTFPAGIIITQFADDADPLDMASIQVADTAMGLNGDLVTWSRAVPIPCVFAVIPGSDDDRNLSVLLEANRASQGKFSARDIITATLMYPNGQPVGLLQGKITNGMPATSIASAGRMKSKPYIFAFQGKTGNA